MSVGAVQDTPRVGHLRKIDFGFRARFGLLLATVVVAAGFAVPTSAYAGEDGYQCGLMTSETWCKNGVARNFWYNSAHETYEGSVGVCLKMIKQSNSATWKQISCGGTPFADVWELCNCGGVYPLMWNGASGPRQLYGIAFY